MQGLNGNTDRALVRKGGYLHKSMVEVKDGNLHIYTKYLEEGAGGSNGTPYPKSWAGDMSKNDCLPSEFIVDYVRAYRYK